MAEPSPDATVTMTDAPAIKAEESLASRKSYRRKYRKIMVKFEEKMQESTRLHQDEQKMHDIAQRLAEQNDQLLQLLLDMNSMPQIPPTLRYDLDEDEGPNQPRTQVYKDEEAGHEALRVGRYHLQTGEITPAEYETIKSDVLASPAFAPTTSYRSLVKECAKYVTAPPEPDEDSEFRSGFLSVAQEDEYQRALDAFLDGQAPTPRGHINHGLKPGDRNVEREKDLQLRNPVSVYNYLRKHEPKVFLQDEETKPARATGARSSKRSNRDSIIKQEQELYDDDGIALDMPNGRAKRKRDEDGGYRPKGGAPRSAKRKRDSEVVNVGRSRKKASIG